jgi:hypothetical protein
MSGLVPLQGLCNFVVAPAFGHDIRFRNLRHFRTPPLYPPLICPKQFHSVAAVGDRYGRGSKQLLSGGGLVKVRIGSTMPRLVPVAWQGRLCWGSGCTRNKPSRVLSTARHMCVSRKNQLNTIRAYVSKVYDRLATFDFSNDNLFTASMYQKTHINGEESGGNE